jgi:hypothetical protein
VAIVAGVVSIILCLFAIWQSDKVYRVTIAKLSDIKDVTTSTMKITLAQSETLKVIEKRREEQTKHGKGGLLTFQRGLTNLKKI